MLSIVVPYRNREDHLAQFIPHMNKYLPNAKIVIVEQADDKPFNRGKLLNISFKEIDSFYYCFHDVDHLPIDVPYICSPGVNQLAYSNIQTSNFLGAVTMYDKQTFEKSEGYHNDYFHRAEDNEMMTNLMLKRIFVSHRFGTFKTLPHPRTGPEFIPELWQKAQLPRTKNMLKTCEYQLISKEVYGTHTHLRVLL
jgi:hypothetical protein